MRRTVSAVRLGDRLVTTVFDLTPAQYGVGRDGLGDSRPVPYEDAATPCTPAWQEAITSVSAGAVVRAAREFTRIAEQPRGRCVIVMGAGTNHWFHSDTIHRSRGTRRTPAAHRRLRALLTSAPGERATQRRPAMCAGRLCAASVTT
ncbi:hypothetical protein [Streptomyces chartreusis]|uniref:hypothetical protein n=1 Tax=Streptomyces chartreusis TaxID=1969 RepID=UPI0038131E90